MDPTPAGLLAELAAVGVRVGSLWDLVNTRQPYPQAVPVLLDWLHGLGDPPDSWEVSRLRDGLIRALTVREARPQAAGEMVRQMRLPYREEYESGRAWVAGNALGVVADASVYPDFVALLTDRGLGRAREKLFSAVPRIAKQRPELVSVVRGLLDDDTVVWFVVDALGRMAVEEAEPDLRQLVDHENARVRRAVQVSLRRIETARSSPGRRRPQI